MATREDLTEVVALAHAMKQQLAVWSPTYFRPRAGARELHALYLEYLIESPDHRTDILEEHAGVAGFFAVVPQSAHNWVDDLYLGEAGRWRAAVEAINAAVDPPWVTCVSRFDHARADALRAAGLEVASSYWGRLLDGVAPVPAPRPGSAVSLTDAPPHTFGPGAFDPGVQGALFVGDDAGGTVVGAPSVSPPLYDPGGPACVIDRVLGPDREALVRVALGAAATRGDAAMVIVCGHGDDDLETTLASWGFRAEVDLFGMPGRL
jgi:hypothetical protein